MNAVDVTARGLAKRALDAETHANEGTVSIAARSKPTAAALEALSANFAALTGYAGQTHTVETTPYLTRDGLVIRGNGAELRNINQTPLTDVPGPSITLPLGNSNVWNTDGLTYYSILSTNGNVLTVGAGEGANFAPGDLVVVHGETKVYYAADDFNRYRNYTRARVLDADESTITLDRILPDQLLADAPSIGNVAGNGFGFFQLFGPHLSNMTIASDVGETVQGGGIIDGTFRDLVMQGRNAIALNAMQDCLFENIHFISWRKIVEIAEGSVGTTVRGLRGCLLDWAPRDVLAPVLFMAIHENSSHCVIEDFQVNTGPNSIANGGVGVRLGGVHNQIRNGVIWMPNHTGVALGVLSGNSSATGRQAAAPEVADCGFSNVTCHAPQCSTFLYFQDGGTGLVRPFTRDSRFYGSPSVRALLIGGTDGRVESCWFENGAAEFSGTPTGWTVRDCFIPGGFKGLIPDVTKANPGIADNESNASRSLNAAAVIVQGGSQAITATSANSPWQQAILPAGALEPYDRIHVYAEASAGGSGTTGRNCRVSITSNGVVTGIGSGARTSSGPLFTDAEIWILADNAIGYRSNVAGAYTEGQLTVASLAANSLTVTAEYWCGDPANPVYARTCRIIPVKPGMRHLPLR